MAVYAVGDIQGCYEPLSRLLDRVKFDPARDKLWCTGDLVNRGPDSLRVLRFMRGLGDACISVLGNHDIHLLGQVAGEQPYRRDTLQDVLAAPDRDELIEWLRRRPLMHRDASRGWCLVHAGLAPAWTMAVAEKRARAVEACFRASDWREFCRHIHSHDFPRRDPCRDGMERMLFNVAVFTRARYCTPGGRFDWQNRSGPPRKAGERPWYAHANLAWRNACRVVFGHWAARGLVTDQPHVLGLDSGCVWGGHLTLARLNAADPELVSVPCEPCQRPGTVTTRDRR